MIILLTMGCSNSILPHEEPISNDGKNIHHRYEFPIYETETPAHSHNKKPQPGQTDLSRFNTCHVVPVYASPASQNHIV